jgi:hypothetical protein
MVKLKEFIIFVANTVNGNNSNYKISAIKYSLQILRPRLLGSLYGLDDIYYREAFFIPHMLGMRKE